VTDPFEEWLQTEVGQHCASWPVDGPEFLRNRLWWAFNTGRNSYAQSSQFANREQPLNTEPQDASR